MSNHLIIQAVESIEEALTMEPKQADREKLLKCSADLQLFLRGRGIFLGSSIVPSPTPYEIPSQNKT